MIRTTATPRPSLRVGAAAAIGVAGAFALAACSAPAPADTATAEPDTAETQSSADSTPSPTADASVSDSGYADGTYSASGSYATPESVETIDVTVTLADGVIMAVEVEGNPQKPESQEYQGQFIGGISDAVVGKSIDEIQVSRVAGSSLTSGGFNEAIEQIKSEATV